MRKVYIFLFTIFSITNLSAYEYKIVGEVLSTNPITKEVKVFFFQPKKIQAYQKFILLNGKQEAGYFFMRKQIKKNIFIGKTSIPVFRGQKLALARKEKETGHLPDRIFRQKEKPLLIYGGLDKAPMVYIPAGPFVYGTDDIQSTAYTAKPEKNRTQLVRLLGQKRIHYYILHAFYIDRYEVTLGQWQKFLQDHGKLPQKIQNPNLPVTHVSYYEAERYCKYVGKRLPTELEWEKAARGTGLERMWTRNEEIRYRDVSIVYPTGNEFFPDLCVTLDSNYDGPQPITDLKDKSPYGLFGMCGNAAEWTSSWFLPYRGNTKANPLFGARYKVIRGGKL
ncbi:MAG: hypothetical protein D6767_03220 [Candidatus Hydrogenedentota bacterium]|nr:MAG: hypothetical protein D6767_03220 [Candidatus Hydrogenedentota bacterium]